MELKPCPFCGGKATVQKVFGSFDTYQVGCLNSNCKVEPSTFCHVHIVHAIEAWNRRAEDGK